MTPVTIIYSVTWTDDDGKQRSASAQWRNFTEAALFAARRRWEGAKDTKLYRNGTLTSA